MKKKQWIFLCGTVIAIMLGVGACAMAPREAGADEIPTLREVIPEVKDDGEAVEAVAGEQLVVIDDNMVPLYSKPQGSAVRTPTASGTVTYGNNKATVDASNVKDGYVMVKYLGSTSKIKVQISKDGITYTYDLKARDSYEVFPLSEGNGTYSVKVFENVRGNEYSQILSQEIAASFPDEFSPFLCPNQYVNFSAQSAAVQKGAEIAAAASEPVEVVNSIYNFVVDNLTYDTAKAASVQSGYLPDVDQVLAEKKGICFDYAALMVSMLRSQNIPSKLVVGYTGSAYHAWVDVYIDGIGWVNNYIYFDGQNWSLMDPTFDSSSQKSAAIQEYIGNGANYQKKYCY